MDIEKDFVLSKNNKNNMDIKKEIKNFWNKKPCGTSGNIKEEINEEYFNKIREKRYKLEPFILSTAKFQEWKDKNVLEIGCGIGTDAVEFAKNQAQYTGVDLSSKSIELCKKQFEIYNLNGNIINTDAENLPFENNSFDLVYSWGVLHHIPNIQKVIDEINRVLKPNGKIIIMIYNKYSLVGLQLYVLYGLLKMKIFNNLDNLYYYHHESIGTKAFTDKETSLMFKQFKNLKISNIITPYDLRITRNIFLPKWFSYLIPSRFGFFKIIIGNK